MKALIVIPTYNERENLSEIVPRILAVDPRFEVLVVDDNSADGTREIAVTCDVKDPTFGHDNPCWMFVRQESDYL